MLIWQLKKLSRRRLRVQVPSLPPLLFQRFHHFTQLYQVEVCLGVVKALPHEGTRKVTNTPLEEDELVS